MRCPCCGKEGYSAVTADRLRDLVSYNPKTGAFHWLDDGSPACVKKEGYLVLTIERKRYYAHRLAWLYITGEWPPDVIDHINGNRADNRWINLRAATQSQNLRNSRRLRSNTSGYKGVSWFKANQGWRAVINIDGKQKHLGTFKTPEAAHEAYKTAAIDHFGEFARTE